MANPVYNTLDDIQQRKDALQADIQKDSDRIGTLWHQLTDTQKSDSKGELIANLIANSITAIDAFLLVRKLIHMVQQQEICT